MATGKKTPTIALTKRQLASKALAKKYKSEAAALKRKGLLTSKVNARKDISRYTRTKINKLRPVLEGHAIAVKASREVRTKYIESDRLPVVGRFVLAPKEFANSRASVKRGMIAVTRKLRNVSEEYIILPFKPASIPDLVERLKADPTLNGLKMEGEHFSFRLFGWNAARSFHDIGEMADYVERNYQHLFKYSSALKYLTFQRWYAEGLEDSDEPNPMQNEETPRFGRVGPNGRNIGRGPRTIRGRKKEADRKAKERSRENPMQRERRLAANRQRTKEYKARKKGK